MTVQWRHFDRRQCMAMTAVAFRSERVKYLMQAFDAHARHCAPAIDT